MIARPIVLLAADDAVRACYDAADAISGKHPLADDDTDEAPRPRATSDRRRPRLREPEH